MATKYTPAELETRAREIAVKYGIDPDLISRLGYAESRWNPSARSGKGAIGPLQLMPGTARDLGVDPTDPLQNIEGGVRYLAQNISRFGSLPLGLAAYNAGPGNVARGTVPPETTGYVRQVMGQDMPVIDPLNTSGSSGEMLKQLIQSIQDQQATAQTNADTESQRLNTDYEAMGKQLQQSDASIADMIRNTPTESTRPRWQQGIAAILGGATENAFQGEITKAQQIHKDLIMRSIEQNGRLADAYLKVGDLVNANKYTKAAQMLAEKNQKLFELQKTAVTEAGATERAEIMAGSRLRTKPEFFTPAEFQKQWNTTVRDYMDKKGNIPESAKEALRSSLVLLRSDAQTPLAWVQHIFGAMPGSKGTLLRGFLGIGEGAEKPLFDIHDEAHWRLIQRAGAAFFTPEELNNPRTGENAVQQLHDRSMGITPSPNTPGSIPEPKPAENPIGSLRSEANDLTKQLASLRRESAAPLSQGRVQSEARQDKAKAIIERLKVIRSVLKLHGMDLLSPSYVLPQSQGIEVNANK